MEEFNPYDGITQTPYVLPQSNQVDPRTIDDTKGEEKNEVGSDPLLHAMEVAAGRNRRAAFSKVLLPALGIAMAVIGLLVVLNVYVFGGRHVRKLDSMTIGTTAQPQYIVTISQVLSSVVDRSTPFLALVLGYYVAADWLSLTNRTHRPTIQQYGIALNNLRSGHFGTLLATKINHEDQRAGWSEVSTATLFVGWLVGTSFVVAFFDFILHLATAATLYQHAAPYPSTSPRDFGRVVNEGSCQAYRTANPASISTLTCGLIGDDGVASAAAVASGLQGVTSSSPTSKVVSGDTWNIYDDVILVPGTIPSNITYSARTYGVTTSCQSLTSQCVNLQAPRSSTDVPVFNCGGQPPVVLDNASIQAGNLPLGVVYPNGTVATKNAYQAINTNPFPVIAVVNSLAHFNSSGLLDPDLGFYSYGNRAWNVYYCNVSTDIVEYTYRPTTTTKNGADYTIKILGPAPMNASILTGAMIASGLLGPRVSQATDGVQLFSMGYDELYPIQLSRHLLAFSSMAYTNTDVQDISGWVNAQGTSVLLPVLALYYLAVLAYLVQVILIGCLSFFACLRVPWTDLGQQWLTSPVPLINACFGPVNSEKTWKNDPDGLFEDETTADRLSIGPMWDNNGKQVFGVYRNGVAE